MVISISEQNLWIIAVENEDLEDIKHLHLHNIKGYDYRVMNLAAKNGALKIVKFLTSNRYEICSSDAMSFAAGNGHLEIVQLLYYSGNPCTYEAVEEAAYNGHLEIVKFLYVNRPAHFDISLAINHAAMGDRLEVIQFLFSKLVEKYKNEAIIYASYTVNSKVIYWLDQMK